MRLGIGREKLGMGTSCKWHVLNLSIVCLQVSEGDKTEH
jgi:hypothetical protein